MYFATDTEVAIDILRAIIEPLIYGDKYSITTILNCTNHLYGDGLFNDIGSLICIGHEDNTIEEMTQSIREELQKNRGIV